MDQAVTVTPQPATSAGNPSAPDYVEYGALVTVPPPYACTGAVLTAFVVEADAAKLAQLVDRVIVAPSGGTLKYEPLGHFVMLSFGSIARIQPTTPPYSRQGAVTESNATIWVPIAAADGSAGPAFAVITPYMWVDNPMSLPDGREVFGYPKSWGWPALPANDDGPWGLDAFGVNYDRNETAGRHPLLAVTRLDHDADPATAAAAAATPSGDDGEWTNLAQAADYVRRAYEARTGGTLKTLAAIVEDLIHERVEQLFLKQVRAVDGGRGAALQQVCGATIQVDQFRGAPLLGHFHVEVSPLDSIPLGPELGLVSQDTCLAFAVNAMDFTLEAGAILHSGDRADGRSGAQS